MQENLENQRHIIYALRPSTTLFKGNVNIIIFDLTAEELKVNLKKLLKFVRIHHHYKENTKEIPSRFELKNKIKKKIKNTQHAKRMDEC